MFAACTNNNEEPNVKIPAFDKLHATIANEASGVEAQSGLSAWSKGDKLSVFNKSTENEQWTYTGANGSTSGDLVKGSDAAEATGTATDKVIALYPYDKNATIDGNSVATTIPATQTYKSGSFGKGSIVMTAISDDDNLSFNNVLGYIKLNVTGKDAVKSITLKGNNNEILAGSVTINTETAAASASDNKVKAITLDCGNGVQLSETATDFYIGILPQTFSKGITVTVETADGNLTEKSSENSLTVARNSIAAFEAIEASAPVALECELSIILGPVSELYPELSASYPDDTSLMYAIIADNEAKITKLNMALVETAQITASGLSDQEVMDFLGDEQTNADDILDDFNTQQGYANLFINLDPETEYTFIVAATNEYGNSTLLSTKCTTAAQDFSEYKGELVIGQYHMTYKGEFTSENTFTVIPSGNSTTEFIIKNLGIDNSTSWYGQYDPATSKFTVNGIEVGYESYGNQFGAVWGFANSTHTQVLVFWSGLEKGTDPCVFSVDPVTKQICQLDTYFSTDVYSYASNQVGNYLGSYTEFDAGCPVTYVSNGAAAAKCASAQPCKLHNGAIKSATVKGATNDKNAALKCAKSAAVKINAAALR